jgi:hypothetical protein
LSAGESTFKYDLGSEDREGGQDSTISVFTRGSDGTLRHFYSGHPWLDDDIKERRIDELSPIWNLLDLTPQGRGTFYYVVRLRHEGSSGEAITNTNGAEDHSACEAGVSIKAWGASPRIRYHKDKPEPVKTGDSVKIPVFRPLSQAPPLLFGTYLGACAPGFMPTPAIAG